MTGLFVGAAAFIEREAGLLCGQCNKPHWESDETAPSGRCGCCPPCRNFGGRWLYRMLPEDLRPRPVGGVVYVSRAVVDEYVRRLRAELAELQAEEAEWLARGGGSR